MFYDLFQQSIFRAERESSWIDPGLGRMGQQGIKSSESCNLMKSVDSDERFSALAT